MLSLRLCLEVIGSISEIKINRDLFCISLDLHYLCPRNINYIAYELLRNGTIGTDERSSQRHLDALRLTLSLFFAERAQKAIDKMWDEGSFDQKKLDELRGQHLRTPYK